MNDMVDFVTANLNALMVFALFMIVFLLMYIAFGPTKKRATK